tara:strand:- start:201 stop:569 length:369 start_codon:yes stop_codon:yes gene_type:complete
LAAGGEPEGGDPGTDDPSRIAKEAVFVFLSGGLVFEGLVFAAFLVSSSGGLSFFTPSALAYVSLCCSPMDTRGAVESVPSRVGDRGGTGPSEMTSNLGACDRICSWMALAAASATSVADATE